MQYNIDDNWYSWIPTNRGHLNFNYIGDKFSIEKTNGYKCNVQELNSNKKEIHIIKTNLSDLNKINNFFKGYTEQDNSAVVNIELKENSFSGNVTLSYKSNQQNSTDIIVAISSEFMIEFNGKTKINNIAIKYDIKKVEEIKKSDILDQTIVNAIYTILKNVVHGDNHHKQKIDTFIGVYKDSFDNLKILKSFATHIKSRERIIKDPSKNNCHNVQEKILYSMEMEGFLSYIETFKELFCTNNEKKCECEQEIKFIRNVIQSLKASIEKIKYSFDQRQKLITLGMTLLAFLISINLFHNGLYGSLSNSSTCLKVLTVNAKVNYMIWSFFLIVITYLIFVKFLCISKIVSKVESLWEYLRYSALIDHNKNTYILFILVQVSFTILLFIIFYTIKTFLELMLNYLLQ